ncbi:MAG: MFS transporter [Sphingomonadaceae bacterium]|nr:MFS transporter [Sphingomonadaceae bacterium]
MATAAAGAGVPKRLILVAMCFAATSICYVDRVNISVAVIPMASRFGWSATTKGAVLTSFFVGYLLAMLPTGMLTARLGGRRVLGAALAGWSLATLATPAAAFAGLPALLAVRVLMGTAEAATFPAAIGLFARWLPAGERSRAVALNLGGIPVGTVVGLSAAGALIAAFGWPAMFVVFGLAGLAFAGLWFVVVRDSPAEHPRVGAAEAALLAEQAAATAPAAVPWRVLFGKRACWAILVNHFASNWVLYLMLTWLPSYLHDARHLDVAKAGLTAVLPWLSLFVTGNAAGHIGDALVARGVSLLTIRKAMQVAALVGSAAALLLAERATGTAEAVALLCVAMGFLGLVSAGYASNHLDIAPRHAAPLYALTNTAGTVPGIVGVYVTGALLDATGNYAATFALAAGVNLIGALIWLLWARADCVVD